MTTSTARRPLSVEAVIDRMGRRLVKAGKPEYIGCSTGHDIVVSTPRYFTDGCTMLILDSAHGAPVSGQNIYELFENAHVPVFPAKYDPLTGTGSRRVYISVNLLSDIVRANGGRRLSNIVPVYVGNDTYCNGVYLLDMIDALSITDGVIPLYVYREERTSMPLICAYNDCTYERGALLPIRYGRDCNPYTPAGDITLLPGVPGKRAQIAALIDSYRMHSVTSDRYVDGRSYCTFDVPTEFYNAAENMPRTMSLSIVDAVNMFAKINELVSRSSGLAFDVHVTLHRPGRDIDAVKFVFVLDGGKGTDGFDNTAFTVISSDADFNRRRFWGAYNSERMMHVMAARKAAAEKYVKSTAVKPAIVAPAYKPATEIVKPAPVATQTAVNATATAPAIDTPAAPAASVKPVVRPVHAAPVKPVYVHIVPAVVPAIRVPATAGRYTFDRAAADFIATARPGTSTAAPTVNQSSEHTPRAPFTRPAVDTYTAAPALCTPDYMPPRISPVFDVYAAYMARDIDTPPRALTPLTAAYSPVRAAVMAGEYMARVDTAAAYAPPADSIQDVPPAGDYSPDISETAGGSYSPMYTAPGKRGGRYAPPITEPPGSAQGAQGGRGARSITPAAGVPPIMSPPPIMGGAGRIAPIIAAPPYNGKRPYNSRHTYTAGGSMSAGVPPDSDGAPLQRAPKNPIMRSRREKRIMPYNAI